MDLAFLKRGRRFRTLVDIGANDGAYGAHLREFFAIERVFAFEPLPAHAAGLSARGFEVHPVALAAAPGRAPFIVNRYDAASSLRRLTPATASEWPEAAEATTIEVEKARLDDRLLQPLERDVLVKVDAQGAEPEIIDGGRRVFGEAAVVLIETCFVALYEGQGLFDDIHRRLSALGLRLAGIKHQHIGKDGRPLFAHAIYER
jgi:FkbM family methyltransferase